MRVSKGQRPFNGGDFAPAPFRFEFEKVRVGLFRNPEGDWVLRPPVWSASFAHVMPSTYCTGAIHGKQKKAVAEYVAIHKLTSPLETKAMRTKNPQAFRLSDKAVEALENEAARTGKSKTGVIEDLLLWQRLFSDEAEAAMNYMAKPRTQPSGEPGVKLRSGPEFRGPKTCCVTPTLLCGSAEGTPPKRWHTTWGTLLASS